MSSLLFGMSPASGVGHAASLLDSSPQQCMHVASCSVVGVMMRVPILSHSANGTLPKQIIEPAEPIVRQRRVSDCTQLWSLCHHRHDRYLRRQGRGGLGSGRGAVLCSDHRLQTHVHCAVRNDDEAMSHGGKRM